jgi:ubiquinone/menaquinone biosynthesis C-methylase UbiE
VKQRIIKAIPKPLKVLLKRVYYIPVDLFEMLTKRDDMIPPRSMIFIGAGDFIRIGEGFKRHFIDLGHLQPNERVLDVGCGIGRMAIPLTNYLSEEGEYWGFDIVKKGIDWCQERITPKFKNFHFLHSDIYNKYYNPNGSMQARNYRFPFADGFFDFVFLTSVFTHMRRLDVENYMGEISRVLKAGGRCLITFFILNEESLNLMHSGKSRFDFKYDLGGCLSTDVDTPEEAIAYEEEVVKNLFDKNGLAITPSIYYGSWCGREKFFTYQDLIVAEKKGSH